MKTRYCQIRAIEAVTFQQDIPLFRSNDLDTLNVVDTSWSVQSFAGQLSWFTRAIARKANPITARYSMVIRWPTEWETNEMAERKILQKIQTRGEETIVRWSVQASHCNTYINKIWLPFQQNPWHMQESTMTLSNCKLPATNTRRNQDYCHGCSTKIMQP